MSTLIATLALASLLASPETPAGHRRMVEVLAEIARTSDDTNPYTGDLQARAFRRFAAVPAASGGPYRRFVVLRELGHHELRLGNDAVAVERFREAREMVPSLGAALRPADVDRIQLDLAIAWLRWGESRNCVARHSSASCIAPIAPAGVHQDQGGSRRAIAELESLLRRRPDHLPARWLLNVAQMTVGGYPQDVPSELLVPPSVFASEEQFPRFVDVAVASGLEARDLGGGVVAEDFDADGRIDVVVSSSDPKRPLRYFAGGASGLGERSAAAGFDGLLGGANLVTADYDGDGDLDLLVLRGAWLGRNGRQPKSLLRNDGHGAFTDVTFDAGLGEVSYPSQTAAWADYDKDGDLDLYVGNEWGDNQRFPSQLFRNRGDGSFEDVAPRAGVENRRLAKGVAWGDFDDDSWPDLYVSNLNGDNRLYRNRGDGTFEDTAAPAGVARPWSSLGVAVIDYDDDGNLDLFVGATSPRHGTDVIANRIDETAPLAGAIAVALDPRAVQDPSRATPIETSRLFRGLGNGRFEDVTVSQGLSRAVLTGGVGVGDFDGDGWVDLYLGKTYPGFEGLVPNKLYRNRGGGRGFADVTTAAGVGHLQKASAVAVADFDGDGDEDVFVNAGGMYRGDVFSDLIFANPGNGNHGLDVRVPLGSRVRARIGDRWLHRTASTTSRVHLGLGQATVVDQLEITYPTGRKETRRNVPADTQRRAFLPCRCSVNLSSLNCSVILSPLSGHGRDGIISAGETEGARRATVVFPAEAALGGRRRCRLSARSSPALVPAAVAIRVSRR